MSISTQLSQNAKNKKNNTIIHQAPAPKNPSSPNNLSNIVYSPYFLNYNTPPQLHNINNIIKNGIHAIMSMSTQLSPNARNKKNNTIIHQAPAPKNPPSPNNLSNILFTSC